MLDDSPPVSGGQTRPTEYCSPCIHTNPCWLDNCKRFLQSLAQFGNTTFRGIANHPSPQWRLPRCCVNDTTTKQSAICRDRPPQINGACESALKEDIHGTSFQSDFDDGISCRNHHTRNVRGKS